MENANVEQLLQQVKLKLLERVNNALASNDALSAETVGYLLNGVAKFEENEIARNRESINYNKVVEDVTTIVEKLPTAETKTLETL